jgi:hypothetical protein
VHGSGYELFKARLVIDFIGLFNFPSTELGVGSLPFLGSLQLIFFERTGGAEEPLLEIY